MKHALSLLVIYTLLVLVGLSAFAERVTLQDVRDSLAQHPLLQASVQQQEAARAELLAALGAFDPKLLARSYGYASGAYDGTQGDLSLVAPTTLRGTRLQLGARESSGYFPPYEDLETTNSDGELRFGLEIPLLRDGSVDSFRAALEKAKLQQGIASQSLRERALELERLASITYWEWMAACQQARSITKLANVALERQKYLEEAVLRGDLAQFTADENSLILVQRKIRLQAAEQLLERKAIELSLFFRTEDGKPRRATRREAPNQFPSLPLAEKNLDDIIQQALAARPELIRIGQEKKRNEVDRSLMRNQVLPRLDLKADYSRDYGQGPWKESDDVKLLLGFEIPLFNRSARGQLAVTEAKALELQEKERFLRESIEGDIRKLFILQKQYREQSALARKELYIAKKVEDGERIRFQEGSSNLVFVNLREQSSTEAELRVIDSLASYHQVSAELQVRLGESRAPMKELLE
jgi:cobalt-zinc-cadmium efflux system outer membrane protein